MPITVRHTDSPSTEALALFLEEFSSNGRPYAHVEAWSLAALEALPGSFHVFTAIDAAGPVGALFLSPGFLEPWAAPTDLLGGNPIVPQDQDAAAIHAALLVEAMSWTQREQLSGLEILLPMGPGNARLDGNLDRFCTHLGFERYYCAMARELASPLPNVDLDEKIEIVPAASLPMGELYKNYAACTAGGEIELIARQSPTEHNDYFDSLATETLGHPGSLALLRDDLLLGFALVASISDTTAHLAWIGILPEQRHHGLGQRLLLEVLEMCRTEHLEHLSLYTDTSVGAQTLYHKVGFVPAGVLTYRWRTPEEP